MKETGRLVVLALATFVLYSCNITLTPDSRQYHLELYQQKFLHLCYR